MNPEYATLKDHEIEQIISELQAVQKKSPPFQQVWQDASAALQPLFAEMAERTAR